MRGILSAGSRREVSKWAPDERPSTVRPEEAERAGRDPEAEHKGLFHQPLLKGHAVACYPHN